MTTSILETSRPDPIGPVRKDGNPERTRETPAPEQLSDEVAAYLRVAIMSGTLRPGTFVRLDETAAQLGVSITPVREALRTLRGEGMVRLEPHRGHMVTPFTRDDIADIFWLQSTIAAKLAASAAQRATDADIDEMAVLTDRFEAAVQTGNVEAIAMAEFEFHRCVNQSANRVKLAWFLLHAARYLPPHIYAADPTWSAGALANHRALVSAMRTRDVEEVLRLTRDQFSDAARRLTTLLDELGLWT